MFLSIPSYGMLTDTVARGGYLYVVYTDHLDTYDLTDTYRKLIGSIQYEESILPINADIDNNRIFVYYYYDEDNNGIRIYDMQYPHTPSLIKEISIPNSLIQGGYLSSWENVIGQRGQFLAFGNYLLFVSSTSLDTDSDSYAYKPYRYNISTDELYQYTFNHTLSVTTDCDPMAEDDILYYDTFFVTDGDYFTISRESSIFTTNRTEMLYNNPCFMYQGYSHVKYGFATGPYATIEHKILAHWTGIEEPGNFLGSGVVIVDTWHYPGLWSFFFSDFLCTYADKHSGNIGEINNSNSQYDVQGIIVHNGEIYLSSYYTRSIAHTYYYQDWGTSMSCQDYWNFYDLPETGRPYGIAAANATLYVAGKDKLYEFPLAKPDEELPVGDVYSANKDDTTFTVSGWAGDSEGIKQITVRLDNVYQFVVDRISNCRFEPPCQGHCLPIDRCTDWILQIPLQNILPGSYTMKVIAEDMDGDFSVIHEQVIDIHGGQLLNMNEGVGIKPGYGLKK
ncbi:MAG TPA: hypothetical protein PK014_08435 [Thermoanaerobaculia bacterium]|nr:hypothetical protein [Thermoanaerobaculia bacterium]HXK68406.1 hypothetical protein [Thermoanaerobaculia bacterium]